MLGLNFKLYFVNNAFLNAYKHGESIKISSNASVLNASSPEIFSNTGPSIFCSMSPFSFTFCSLNFIMSMSFSRYVSNVSKKFSSK